MASTKGSSSPVEVEAATSDDISGGGLAGPIAHDVMKAVIDSGK
ncbi:hypothetical protein [Streptomyces sp. NBC_01497]|nr:hypothetical protein [Streptomyces sp. NBC_01497]